MGAAGIWRRAIYGPCSGHLDDAWCSHFPEIHSPSESSIVDSFQHLLDSTLKFPDTA